MTVMVGYSAAQVRAAEEPLLAAGVPLMARAAAGLAAVIREVLVARGATAHDEPVLLLVGPGNNGGDALFAGAELAADGVLVCIATVSSHAHEEGLAAALASGARIVDADPAALVSLAQRSAVLVDGLFGTGSAGSAALRGPARELVLALQPALARTRRPVVVAVDIPSGIDADSGAVPDAAVLEADITVTFRGVKAGLLQGPGRDLAGTVRLIDIGLGGELAKVIPTFPGPAETTSGR